jgi:Protein of unknown function (DUF992)
MLRLAIGAAAVALAVIATDPAAAQRPRAGLLTCDVSGGFGLIIGSQKQVSCVFAPDQPGFPQEGYVGAFTRFGLDIGITAAGVMVWAVFTETTRGPGFLAGDYVGASGEVTVAAGLGANVLVGGSNRTIALQPFSVSGQVGLNLALGIGDLSLRPAGR